MNKTRNVYFCNYSIGENPYLEIPALCGGIGTRILVVGGEKALAAALPRLTAALNGSSLEIVDTLLFGSDCTPANILTIAERAQKCQADMIFGIGGGKALDTAKGAADEAKLPVYTFPTIASTCAATTALSVVYREDGNFDSFYFYDRPARHCFIDLTVIANAPDLYLQAGMGDTIGKFFECHFAARGDKLTHRDRKSVV